jgi:hypothetical protein
MALCTSSLSKTACCRLEVALRDFETEIGGGAGGTAVVEPDATDEASVGSVVAVPTGVTLGTTGAARRCTCADAGGADLSCGGTIIGVVRGGAGH